MGNKITTTVKNVANKLNPWAKPPVNEEEEEDSPYEPEPLRIVERKEWNPRKPKYRQVLKTPVKHYLLRYFTNTEPCEGDEECFDRLKELQDKHMEEGLPDIAFNFLIGDDGTVYEGRGWTTKPTKLDYRAMKLNGKSIDIALFGDYKTTYPPEPMQEAACRLMQRGVVLGHAIQGWEVDEYREDLPCGKWSRDEFGPDDDEKIYDNDTEPPPEVAETK